MAKKKAVVIPNLVRKTTAKEFLKDTHNMRISGEFLDGADAAVMQVLSQAATRAKDNNRKTVKVSDL